MGVLWCRVCVLPSCGLFWLGCGFTWHGGQGDGVGRLVEPDGCETAKLNLAQGQMFCPPLWCGVQAWKAAWKRLGGS
ncbi:MAG: hypothetical protein EAY75_03650 [Bacteroidetes bacterium]|nr:MAG: hypothetical protein EAY75_03650 [Bacteroidota bacterium]